MLLLKWMFFVSFFNIIGIFYDGLFVFLVFSELDQM